MSGLTKRAKGLRLGDLVVRRNPLYYSRARSELRALSEVDLVRRREWTDARLRAALAAAAHSPYGRRVGGGDEIERWPLLEKSDVRAAPDAFRRGGQLFTVKARTGGTSGAPLALTRSLRSVVVEQVAIDEMLRRLGVDGHNARVAVLRGDDIKDPSDSRPPFWRQVAGGRRLLLSSNHLGPATIEHYVAALEEFEPDVLWCYPSALGSLCVQLARAGRTLKLPRVLTSSEVLAPSSWRQARDTLGCELLDYYGQAERVAFAWAQRPGEYWFLPGYAHVELLPVREDAGETTYEIVGTSLWNGSMHLVRYRTGDLLRLPSTWASRELEEVVLGVRSFDGVLGRDGDVLVSPDGRPLVGIDHIHRDVDNLVRIQIVQDTATEVRIRVLPAPGFSERDSEQLLAAARRKLPSSMRVSIEMADSLERTTLGKTPFVIHRAAVAELLRGARREREPA